MLFMPHHYGALALGSRGDVVFGDWSHYIVAMEEEVVVQRSEHYKFKNNVTAFRLSVVVGGKVAEPRAFAILDNVVGTTTQGNAGSTTTGGSPGYVGIVGEIGIEMS